MKLQLKDLHRRQGLFFVALMILTLIALPLVLNQPNFAQEPQKALVLGEPDIIVKNEPDAPILLSLPTTGSRALDGSKYQVMLTNVSTKPIYAYALRYPDGPERSRAGSLWASSSASIDPILIPGQWTIEEIYEKDLLSKDGARIIVLLDLVMFTDGTTWGSDINGLAGGLAGQRAGISAASRQLQKLLKTRGYAAVQVTSEADISYFSPPPDQTPEWMDGFKSGINFVREMIKQAYGRGGEAEVELELQRRAEGERR